MTQPPTGNGGSRSTGRARYVMIGGFLGAGKTTSIVRFADWLGRRGASVGLVTNDQGGGLVDTALVRSRNLPVEEITGGCFCCRFASLVEAAEKLSRDAAPDVLLAEPVGSCTDLAATVGLPLARIYGDRFTVAPLSVVVDPLRAERVLGLAGASLSEKVGYIYRKQLEEAEIVVVNKTDLVEADRLERLKAAVAAVNPTADILAVSARDGVGLERWFEMVLGKEGRAAAIADIDYDRYADGEALLGWLNADLRLAAGEGEPGEFDGNAAVLDLLAAVRRLAEEAGWEIAHLKATLSPEGDPFQIASANLVRTDDRPVLSHRLPEPIEVGRLLVNLRAEADPAQLDHVVRRAAGELAPPIACEILHLEHFRPGRPVPTHRFRPDPPLAATGRE
jgi:Ni2+-binding GTPase involved in maturation of urease and hydrogenase